MDEIFNRVSRFCSDFLDEVRGAYDSCSNVTRVNQWYNRFDQLARAVTDGTGTYRQVEDHIFELKVMNFINSSFSESTLSYEPAGTTQDGKNCDIEVIYRDFRFLIELKSFHPDWKPAPIPEQHVAENNKIMMDGECYHTYQATRGHLIDVTRHTEEKISNYDGEFTSVLAVPVGFHLNIEDLRDFVFIYRHGQPRPDDPLGPMTMHNINEPFKQNIEQFWAFPFLQTSFSLEPEKSVMTVSPLKCDDRVLDLDA